MRLIWKKKRIMVAIAGIIFTLLNSSFGFAGSENYKIHIVKKDDMLFGIIKRTYKLDWDYWKNIEKIIRKINGLKDDEKLYVGQKLIIPLKGGIWHEVKEGEGLWRIAQTYGVSEKDIIEINNVLDRDKLTVGQRLFIPGAKKVLRIEIPEKVKPDFCWPAKGKIIKYFDKNNSKGIDIAVPGGTTIVASFKGKVSHEGYHSLLGWYLFIYHKDIGLYTCYTHISSVILVKKGDTVEKREPIALVEYPEEGNISYFHFEVRKANNPYEAVDPLQYLPKEILIGEK